MTLLDGAPSRKGGTFGTARIIGCSFKFILKIGVEESIVIASRISCLNLTSLFVLFVFLHCRLTSGAFTIDSSTPTFRINLNEHPISYETKNFQNESVNHIFNLFLETKNYKPQKILNVILSMMMVLDLNCWF
jgi:hypothetical protein